MKITLFQVALFLFLGYRMSKQIRNDRAATDNSPLLSYIASFLIVLLL